MLNRCIRKPHGLSVFIICLLLSFIVFPVIGVLTFELVRATSVKDQLQAACDAAALSGAAALASSDETNIQVTHSHLIDSSLNTFKANSIFSDSLSGSTRTQSLTSIPASAMALFFVELLDPTSAIPNSPVQFGDSRGRIVHVVALYGLEPVFGGFLGIKGPYTIRADAYGRVPQLDIVLCFDVSGSIDDQTPVTFVKRYWDASTSRNVYKIATARPGGHTLGGLAQGGLFDVLGPPPEGSGVNGLPPQNLDSASSSTNSRRLTFSSSLRGSPNTSGPPGNYPSGSNAGDSYTFTDMIVNINETSGDHCLSLPWTSPGGFYYPTLEAVVEAQRGNLENGSVFGGAKLSSVPALNGVMPRIGYLADYRAQAKQKIRPLKDAQDAAINFFVIMNNNTEAHFGLVTFASDAGTLPTDSVAAPNVASNYSAGGNGQFPRPGVSLDQNITQFDQVVSSVGITVANGGTNLGAALYTAKDMMVDFHRPGSRRAIVLFTDGQPTEPGSGSNPVTYTRSAASAIRDQGIPIFTIGLAQNSSIVPGEVNILNDDPNKAVPYTNEQGQLTSYTPGAYEQGISYIAGNGGKFFLVTDASKLRKTFENIARSLVQLENIR